jgi:uncharacterized protein (TIGR00369 family)
VTSRYLEAVRQPGQTVNPLFAFLGVNLVEVGPDRAVLELPLRPEFIQGAGVVAGGVIAALADEAMAHVVLANLGPSRGAATIEMNVRYFRPVRLVSPVGPALSEGLKAVATLANLGRRIVSAEAAVSGPDGRVVAKASGSFFILEETVTDAGPPPVAQTPRAHRSEESPMD